MIELYKRGTIQTKPAVIAMALALGLGACSHGIQIAEHADDYNVTVETAENKMFLRNIIRAAKRKPMYFTRVTSFQSTLSSEFRIKPSLPLGSEGTENYAAGLDLFTRSTPVIQHQVLADDKFFNGIMQPININTFELFIKQGWPQDLLLNVFVEEALIKRKAKDGGADIPLCILRNDPDNLENLKGFDAFVRLVDGHIVVGQSKTTKTFGPRLRKRDVDDSESLKELKDTGLSLLESKDKRTYQLASSSNTKVFKINAPVESVTLKNVIRNYRAPNPDLPPLPCPADAVEAITAAIGETQQYDDQIARRKSNEPIGNDQIVVLTADLQPRSAESMIYYLGELTRVDIDPNWDDRAELAKLSANSSWNVSTNLEGTAAVSIFDGPTWYGVPDTLPSSGDRTMQYLTLVRQIFSLNTASEKVPTVSAPIRVLSN